MLRRLENVVRVRYLDYLSHVHYRNAVAYVLHDAKIVAYEQIRQIQLFLQVLHQVEYLRLDGDVEGGHGFVGYD